MNGELDVQIVDYVSQLLCAQFNIRWGLLPPSHLYGLEKAKRSCDKIPLSEFAVQIHVIPGHYLVSAQINGSLLVIDSLYNKSHLSAVITQLKILYTECAVRTLKYITPQSQGPTKLFGFFSIANVEYILSNRQVPYRKFAIHSMRNHLQICLIQGHILPFPLLRAADQLNKSSLASKSAVSVNKDSARYGPNILQTVTITANKSAKMDKNFIKMYSGDPLENHESKKTLSKREKYQN